MVKSVYSMFEVFCMRFFKTQMVLALGLVLCLSILPGGALASAELPAVSLGEAGLLLPAAEPLPEESALPAADGAAETEGVAIDSDSFPDPAFRTLVSRSYDRNGDGYLSPADAAVVQAIDCAAMGIADLTGIGYFTALEYLYCDSNRLERLDVSGLASLRSLDCSKNCLTELNVSGCGALRELWAHKNYLTELDLTENLLLEGGISECGLVESEGVDIWSDRVGGVTVTPLKNDTGVRVLLSGGILVNAGNFPDDVFRLFLRDGVNYDGTGYIPAAEAAAVTELICPDRGIADLTGLKLFVNLRRLDCRDNPLGELDLTECPLLERVYREGEFTPGDGFRAYMHEETDGLLMVGEGVPVRIRGGGADADWDGDTDRDDALAVLCHGVGMKPLTEEGLRVADVTRDGAVNARDAIQILRYANGLSSLVR